MADNAVQRLHHITLSTGTAQADVDFFVKVVGQRFVKRTLFYDGATPIYHLYFSDGEGTPGTIMTTFPVRRAGLKGRRGSGQFTAVAYAIPKGAIEFWKEHLARHGHAVSVSERFGDRVLRTSHAGIDFEFIEDAKDTRKPWKSEYVPENAAVLGFHNWTTTAREIEDMSGFMSNAWNFKRTAVDGQYHRFEVNGGGGGKRIDIFHDADLRQGTWTLGEGTVHHGAFEVPDYDTQDQLKFDVEGMGYTDFSDRKHRGYFESIYVRTPGGAMFEATKSLGFTVDEAPENLGTELKISPQFEAVREEMMRRLDDPINI